MDEEYTWWATGNALAGFCGAKTICYFFNLLSQRDVYQKRQNIKNNVNYINRVVQESDRYQN